MKELGPLPEHAATRPLPRQDREDPSRLRASGWKMAIVTTEQQTTNWEDPVDRVG